MEHQRRVMRERKVPSTPLQRVMGFGGLAASLALGTIQESAMRLVGMREPAPSDGSGKAYR